ncbi:MAG TPA: sigma-54 dependent transcriptional regulator [Ignavibacteria bacterium]|nr:sigma-54 dependent transcriptional regulator [Ignavibacteria bacterium]HQY52411.1 sigma-54 dependent transcriptional regulator [Ignavibacteria bacterium]HRB00210.1 sigma-54 dependent transcriptional regulator [Ignavibacteria bacterium]
MQKLLLGNSVQIVEINETIKQVAPTDVSVLITGESGSGKEVVAKSIHLQSKRSDNPLITVNCGAIPEGIIESELFGHQKGAFTGAIDERKGYFEMADKGTIFLDEIGEMPLSTQVKFLRVLETGEFMRVGGNKTISVDVRIVAATNKDLAYEMMNNQFRDDLYYRLRSINIFIPPLRERRSDIKLLFYHFTELYCRENNIEFKGIDDDALDYLINFSWPGNARELKNFCESIIVINPDKILTITDVKKHLQTDQKEMPSSLPILFGKSGNSGNNYNKNNESPEKDFLFRALLEIKSDILDLKDQITDLSINKENKNGKDTGENDFKIPGDKLINMNMNDIEREVLVYLLNKNYWNVEKTAEILDQTPRNVYTKIKKYNISKEQSRGNYS